MKIESKAAQKRLLVLSKNIQASSCSTYSKDRLLANRESVSNHKLEISSSPMTYDDKIRVLPKNSYKGVSKSILDRLVPTKRSNTTILSQP